MSLVEKGVTVCVEGCVPGREGGHCLCGRCVSLVEKGVTVCVEGVCPW